MTSVFTHRARDPRVLAAVLLVLIVAVGFSDLRFATMATHAPRGLVRIGQVASDFGLSGYMFALSAAIIAVACWARSTAWGQERRRRLALAIERAAYFFATIGVSGLLAQLIKHVVGRGRPVMLEAFGAFHFDPISWRNALASFPSGHSTTVFAAAVALGFIFPRARAAWFVAAVLIAASRVVVGAHYPSDVVAGAALGASVAYALAHVFARRSICFDATSPTLRVKRFAGPVSCT